MNPTITFALSISITKGYNQIQRNSGEYAALYLVPNSFIEDAYIELGVGQTYTSNPGETVSNLVIATSTVIALTAVMVIGPSIAINVNKVFVLDDVVSSFTLTNNGTTAATVNINTVCNALTPTPTPSPTPT